MTLNNLSAGRYPLPIKCNSAPPPVDINEISFSLLFFLIAETESPPPTNEKAPFFVALLMKFAILFVPSLKFLFSKTPKGPFHIIVLEFLMILLNVFNDLGPISNEEYLFSILLDSKIKIFSWSPRLFEHFESTGRISFTLFFSALSSISNASDNLFSS